jgi:hypothetical protein
MGTMKNKSIIKLVKDLERKAKRVAKEKGLDVNAVLGKLKAEERVKMKLLYNQSKIETLEEKYIRERYENDQINEKIARQLLEVENEKTKEEKKIEMIVNNQYIDMIQKNGYIDAENINELALVESPEATMGIYALIDIANGGFAIYSSRSTKRSIYSRVERLRMDVEINFVSRHPELRKSISFFGKDNFMVVILEKTDLTKIGFDDQTEDHVLANYFARRKFFWFGILSKVFGANNCYSRIGWL